MRLETKRVMSTSQEITHLRTSSLKFLHHCFSVTEWDYLTAQDEFRERLFKTKGTGDAVPLVKAGLRLLEKDHQMRNARLVGLSQEGLIAE
jgi:hypothetical protein